VEMAEQWMSQKEAAALCGVSYDTIRRKRKAGLLPRCRREDPADPNDRIPVN
jgi:DNA-binding transcriptional MerR regulator